MKGYPKQDNPANERLACAVLDDPPQLALVVKRTYTIAPDGTCRFANQQLPVHDDVVLHQDADPPKVAAPQWDNDLFISKPMTDVILQGSAYCYHGQTTQTVAELRFADIVRTVAVYGDRRCEWQSNGLPAFTPPKPFETMPLRYENAYGGQDIAALKKYGDPTEESFDFIRPEWQLSTTSPYHYPRNPCGTGYVIEGERDNMDGLRVPNLEWPNDPLTPNRLVVGSTKDWMRGPLPAGFDWYEQAWFPRSAYIGLVPDYHLPEDGVPEVNQGLSIQDLMEPRDLVDQQLHPNFVLGASPGLSTDKVGPKSTFLLVNLSPIKQEYRVQLPSEKPTAVVSLPMRNEVTLNPFLNTVVIRPDENQLITVWSCRGLVQRPYTEPEFDHIPYRITWDG